METSQNSTGETLFDPTLFAADTPASPLAPQGFAAENTIRVTSGPTSETPLAIYDPASRSWRTYEDISLWEEPRFLGILPPSGIAQNGVLSARPMLALHIEGIGSLSWPTPRAAMGQSRNHKVYARSSDKPQNLENAIAAADPAAIGQKVNPEWVEWLMGFPLGWTDLEDSETQSSPKSPKS